jgi:protein associated with RNAse G/E
MREKVIVDKFNPQGELKWSYAGEVVERSENHLVLEAFFDRDDMPFMDTTLRRGDCFIETYYSDRWYNIFEIHDRDNGALKGWYCNITRPSKFTDGRVEYVDLFLDLWVSADGAQTVLDEDEFLAAELDESVRRAAREALSELQPLFKEKRPPN